MSTRQGLTAREVLSGLTDIPEDVSEYGDESCSLDADKSSSSRKDENMHAASI